MKHFSPSPFMTAAVFTLALGGPAHAADPIYIGTSIPMSGGLAFFGQHARWGTELAIEEANAAGGVLGRKLAVEFHDNRCNPSEGVKSVSQMLSQKKYVAILDGLCSSVVLAIMPLVKRAGVPLIVANGSASAIAAGSGVGGNEWTFKVNPADGGLAEAMVAWLHKEGKSANIAALAEDSDFGRGGADAFRIALKKRGLKLMSEDYYPQGTADFTAVLTKLRAQKPDSIALYSVGADFKNLIRQFFTNKVGIPLTGRLISDLIPKEIMASGALEGTTTVQPYTPEIDTPANIAFKATFKTKYGELPNLLSFESYETTKVLIDAIKRAGSDDPAKIRDALVTTKLLSILGTTIEFDKNHLAHNNAVIMRIIDGAVVVLGLSKT
jgi:branched-chain amino acid transport system substrate-binding protein